MENVKRVSAENDWRAEPIENRLQALAERLGVENRLTSHELAVLIEAARVLRCR